MDKTQQSSNINAGDLDDDIKQRLKGDTIGDTLYKESFVIKTLLQLSDLKWSEELEQDLCFLWDMTTEKDVCKYLFHLNYPSLACSAITKYNDEARFVEIMIGILANIIVVDCQKNISSTEIDCILVQINTDDSAILIQIMRFIEAIGYSVPDNVFLVESVFDKIHFILNYSKNCELINNTMQALVRLTENFKLSDSKVNSDLYTAVLQGFDTMFPVEANNFEIDSEETRKVIKTFFRLVTNMCAYGDKYNQNDDIPTCMNNNCSKLVAIICKILGHFSEEQNLFPLHDDFNEYISAFQIIFNTRDVNIISNLNNGLFHHIFYSLCKILYMLHKCKSEVLESFNLVLEVIAYLIYFVERDVLLTELKKFRYRRGIVVLNSLKENSRTFEIDIGEKLRFLFSEFK